MSNTSDDTLSSEFHSNDSVNKNFEDLIPTETRIKPETLEIEI